MEFVLCDFEQGSLIPIWELTTGSPKTQLINVFKKMCEENSIPEAIADITVVKNDYYMVKNKAGGLYWEFSYRSKTERRIS